MNTLDARVREIWQTLHEIPEPGFCEHKTAAFLAEALQKAGFSVQTGLGKTGIAGVLDSGNPGPAVGLRADMDALVHKVDGKDTAIHSCGHDAHASMLLAAAEEAARRGIAKGRLKIVFQPAEELLTGALELCKAGVADDLDYLIGAHLRPVQEARMGTATPALCHGANRLMEVSVHGAPAHGARPHLGVNAANAAAAIVNAVNAIKTDPQVAASVKVTRIVADAGVSNAIPAEAHVSLDLRAQTNAVMQELIEKTENAIRYGALTVGATADILSCQGCPAAEYTDEVTALLSEAIVDVLGKDGLLAPIVSSGSEDFHFFAQNNPKLKVGYLGLGVDLEPGLHHPAMHFNQDGLRSGVEIWLRAIDKLNGLKA